MSRTPFHTMIEAQAQPWHLAVIIPARDEEALLPRCLRSIAAARRCLPSGVTSDVVILADTCVDRTSGIAAMMVGADGCVIEREEGSVGAARRIGTQAALARYRGPLHRCWLANTDADTCVPETWLLSQLTLADEGVHAVAGIIDIDSFSEHQSHVPQRFRETYLIGTDGAHTHVHGANLGVRADWYLAAAGWNDLTTGEDHHLWDRLGQVGARRVSTAHLCVTTSGRRHGRAPSAFAETLAAHNLDAA